MVAFRSGLAIAIDRRCRRGMPRARRRRAGAAPPGCRRRGARRDRGSSPAPADSWPRPRVARPARAAATAAPSRGSAAARKPTPTSRPRRSESIRAVTRQSSFARSSLEPATASTIGIVPVRAEGAQPVGEHVHESRIGTEGGRDRDVGVTGGLLAQVDPHVVAGREQQRHDDRGLVGGEGVEGCRHIGLLHVDVAEPHVHVGKPLGNRADERGDGGLTGRETRCRARSRGARGWTSTHFAHRTRTFRLRGAERREGARPVAGSCPSVSRCQTVSAAASAVSPSVRARSRRRSRARTRAGPTGPSAHHVRGNRPRGGAGGAQPCP